jgi:hypothetical protein
LDVLPRISLANVQRLNQPQFRQPQHLALLQAAVVVTSELYWHQRVPYVLAPMLRHLPGHVWVGEDHLQLQQSPRLLQVHRVVELQAHQHHALQEWPLIVLLRLQPFQRAHNPASTLQQQKLAVLQQITPANVNLLPQQQFKEPQERALLELVEPPPFPRFSHLPMLFVPVPTLQ